MSGPHPTERLASFPSSLRARTRLLRLGPAPALLVHPDAGPANAAGEPLPPRPALLWLHGRTVSKELDSARYQRLWRAGVATAALDLPGHGERLDPALQAPDALPDLLAAALAELDAVVDALRRTPGVDPERLALGGMSAGGMIALRRLGDPHPFRAAIAEATCGDFAAAAAGGGGPAWARFEAARRRGLDPSARLDGWRPLPLLALHAEGDRVVPVAGIRRFVEALRARFAAAGADPELARLVTWPETGAPEEHLGFGRKAGEARALVVDHLARHLDAAPVEPAA